jgi:undecaprenyl-diphosphatase
MPSSHAMVSMIFLGFLISLVLIKGKKPYQKYIVSFVLILSILCIGISRIYLGVHYASDVLLGIFLGILYLLFFFHLKKVKMLFQKEDENEKGETNL